MELNTAEQKYFSAFLSKLKPKEQGLLYLKRLSNGTIEPYFNTYIIGKVHLQGEKYWMQIFKNLTQVEIFEGNLEEMIEKQNETIKYIRKYYKD